MMPIKRFIFTATIFGLIALSHQSFAQATGDDCETFPNVPVDVKTVFADPGWNNSVHIYDLQALDVPGTKLYESILIGLTTYKDASDVHFDTKAITLPNGLSCVKVTHVTVTIGYSAATVYIPWEVAKDTCGGAQVIAHELQHLAAHRASLESSVPIIKQRMNEYLKLNGMFKEINPDYALSLIRNNVNQLLSDVNNELVADERQRQEVIDTPQESTRLGNSCNNQLMTAARFLK